MLNQVNKFFTNIFIKTIAFFVLCMYIMYVSIKQEDKKMKLQEVKDLYKNEFTTFEVYQFTSKRHDIHTDFVRELESHEYNDGSEVVTHQLMDEDDYNSTIFANCSNKFADIYDKNDKVLVIVIK